MNTESASVIKRRLQKTWFYFFNRFGHLSPVQEAVIPKVLEGKNLIVCSPTASGKTEAIVAPVVERLLKDDIGGLKVLYITPTRALANDLFIRLNEPLLNLGIKLRVKTGDKPFFNSKDPPNFIITTPESFDSLLCRYSQAFNGLKFIIIDELHLLDCNYRGDQLRVLLERLRSKITQVNYYMMSATLKEPKETARRYCDNAEIIVVEGKREIFHEFLNISDISKGLSKLISILMSNREFKTLFFCNSRKETEFIGQQINKLIKDFGYGINVYIHHGSLSRRQRLAAEQAIREEKAVFCVATSTLELGIDIGDIDAVVLVHPPPNVSSLLQRIGRGNRRRNYIKAYGLYSDESELNIFNIMFTHARKGEIEYSQYVPSLSAVVQQIFSIMYERGKVHQSFLIHLLHILCDAEKLKKILLHLSLLGYLEFNNDYIYPSMKLLDLADKGFIHSNIPNEKDMQVIDTATDLYIGNIVIEPIKGTRFVLAGRSWEIKRCLGRKIFVKEIKEFDFVASFGKRRSEGKFINLVPRELL